MDYGRSSIQWNRKDYLDFDGSDKKTNEYVIDFFNAQETPVYTGLPVNKNTVSILNEVHNKLFSGNWEPEAVKNKYLNMISHDLFDSCQILDLCIRNNLYGLIMDMYSRQSGTFTNEEKRLLDSMIKLRIDRFKQIDSLYLLYKDVSGETEKDSVSNLKFKKIQESISHNLLNEFQQLYYEISREIVKYYYSIDKYLIFEEHILRNDTSKVEEGSISSEVVSHKDRRNLLSLNEIAPDIFDIYEKDYITFQPLPIVDVDSLVDITIQLMNRYETITKYYSSKFTSLEDVANTIETNIPRVQSKSVCDVLNDYNQSKGYSQLWNTNSNKLVTNAIRYLLIANRYGNKKRAFDEDPGYIYFDVDTGNLLIKRYNFEERFWELKNACISSHLLGFSISNNSIKLESLFFDVRDDN